MDLLDRYLAAVARDLPEAQRADITAELRDEIMSGIEAREAGLGRGLTQDELATALVDFGHPLVVAGRYRRTQHLIGPEVFPFWWAGLRASLLMVAAVYLVLAIIAVVAGEDSARVADRASPSLSFALIFTFGAVTLFCAAVERYGKSRFLGRWKPQNLPPAHGPMRTRFEVMVELAMGAVALLWWLGLIHFRNELPGLGLRVDLAPIWDIWFWPIVAYLVGELAMNGLALLRPGRVRLIRILMLSRNLFGAVILGFVAQADRIVTVSGGPDYAPSILAQIETNFDRGFHVGIGIAVGIFMCLAAVQVWRLWQIAHADRPTPALFV